jgi:hypothetical protein
MRLEHPEQVPLTFRPRGKSRQTMAMIDMLKAIGGEAEERSLGAIQRKLAAAGISVTRARLRSQCVALGLIKREVEVLNPATTPRDNASTILALIAESTDHVSLDDLRGKLADQGLAFSMGQLKNFCTQRGLLRSRAGAMYVGVKPPRQRGKPSAVVAETATIETIDLSHGAHEPARDAPDPVQSAPPTRLVARVEPKGSLRRTRADVRAEDHAAEITALAQSLIKEASGKISLDQLHDALHLEGLPIELRVLRRFCREHGLTGAPNSMVPPVKP